MITVADWLAPATVGLTFTILGTIKLWGLKKGHRGRCRQTVRPTTLRHLTDLGEPQFAAGLPTLVPGDRVG